MDQQVINLLEKYLNNCCTADELKQIHSILQEGRYKEEWEKILRENSTEAERSLKKDYSNLEPERVELLLQRIRSSAGISKEPAILKTNYRWAAVAASILIILTCGLGIFLYTSTNEGDLIALKTQAGEQEIITLSDGTQIRLGNASKLEYPAAFEGDKREVYLTGKAYFQVAHNTSKPFIVYTKQLTVRDIGTSFGIRSYQNDKASVVLVTEGKVSVSSMKDDKNEPVGILLPGEQLAYNRTSDEYVQQTIANEGIEAWAKGKLVFYNQPLSDILRAIERRYKVTVRLEEKSMKNKRITFKQNSKALKDVLKVLSLVSGLNYEIHNQVVVMK